MSPAVQTLPSTTHRALVSSEGTSQGQYSSCKANLRTKILDFRGFYSGIILIVWGGILRSKKVWRFLVGRLDVRCPLPTFLCLLCFALCSSSLWAVFVSWCVCVCVPLQRPLSPQVALMGASASHGGGFSLLATIIVIIIIIIIITLNMIDNTVAISVTRIALYFKFSSNFDMAEFDCSNMLTIVVHCWNELTQVLLQPRVYVLQGSGPAQS